jgi:hypothetical protein
MSADEDVPREEVLRDLLRTHYDRTDPVPDRMHAAALGAFAWREVDRELAELSADSLLTDAAVRSQGGPRLVTFAAGVHVVEMEVEHAGRHRRVVGQVVPAVEGAVRVRTGDLPPVAVDALGRFLLTEVPPGPFSLAWEPASGRAYNTAWIDI